MTRFQVVRKKGHSQSLGSGVVEMQAFSGWQSLGERARSLSPRGLFCSGETYYKVDWGSDRVLMGFKFVISPD